MARPLLEIQTETACEYTYYIYNDDTLPPITLHLNLSISPFRLGTTTRKIETRRFSPTDCFFSFLFWTCGWDGDTTA